MTGDRGTKRLKYLSVRNCYKPLARALQRLAGPLCKVSPDLAMVVIIGKGSYPTIRPSVRAAPALNMTDPVHLGVVTKATGSSPAASIDDLISMDMPAFGLSEDA